MIKYHKQVCFLQLWAPEPPFTHHTECIQHANICRPCGHHMQALCTYEHVSTCAHHVSIACKCAQCLQSCTMSTMHAIAHGARMVASADSVHNCAHMAAAWTLRTHVHSVVTGIGPRDWVALPVIRDRLCGRFIRMHHCYWVSDCISWLFIMRWRTVPGIHVVTVVPCKEYGPDPLFPRNRNHCSDVLVSTVNQRNKSSMSLFLEPSVSGFSSSCSPAS